MDAYALTSEMATTDDYAEKHKYPHSLFVADFAVTHTISWKDLNSAGLIFGKNYTADSVEYTMRVPSAGRSYRGSGDSVRGNPQSNEWDKILDKYDGYIRNCNATYSWGQDVAHNWHRAVQCVGTARFAIGISPMLRTPDRTSFPPHP